MSVLKRINLVLARLQHRLKAGVKVNAKDKTGRTPLHWAASEGHVAALQVLLKAGANVHSLDKTGRTALEVARVGMDRTKSDRTKSIKPFLDVMELLKAHGGL